MVKLLTGNALLRGDVLWWTGSGWSLALADAVPVEDGESLLVREAASERVNDLALVDAEAAPGGGYRPVKIRERIRGFGPTVRADLAVANGDYR